MLPNSATPTINELNAEVGEGAELMQEGYIKSGQALSRLRAIPKEYKKYAPTWEAYCAMLIPDIGKHWTMDGSTANRAIAAVRTAEIVSTHNGVIPKVESVARAIRESAKENPDRQREIWELAVKSHPAQAPTAEWVRGAARTLETEQTTYSNETRTGYVPTFDGDAMVPATTETRIVATVADVAEHVKLAAQNAATAQIKKAGGMKFDHHVSKIPFALVSVDSLNGLVTIKVASNHAAYIRDGIRDTKDDEQFVSFGHYVDAEEVQGEQSSTEG